MVGVKQGENMPPFLFSLFLNDLETFFLENNISDLEQISKKCQDTIACYLKIFRPYILKTTLVLYFFLLNTTIFVLFVFTVSFQMLQYSSKADIAS
jgi:hypothetical protein